MTDDEFEDELAIAAAGGWDELGLDAPGEFRPASIEELMADGQ